MQFTTRLLALLLLSGSSLAQTLSPEAWPVDERANLEQQQILSWPSADRTVVSSKGLVVATTAPIAVYAGTRALEQGGTAADAAAVVALTQASVALGRYVSYAGILQLIYYDASRREVSYLNAGWKAYGEENEPGTIPLSDDGREHGRKTYVPGFMAGIETLHQRFGKLDFEALFGPAIWYAENGVPLSGPARYFMEQRRTILSRTAEGRRFLAGDKGDRFYQPELADLLRHVAGEGARYMYEGPWAAAYIDAVRRDGGKATLKDLSGYRPIWEPPLRTHFHGHDVYAPGASGEGGYTLLLSLNLAEEFNLHLLPPYWKDPRSFNTVARIASVASRPRVPKGLSQLAAARGIELRLQDRAEKSYAKAMALLMTEAFDAAQLEAKPPHTDAIVVIDAAGNIAVLAHTINTNNWGGAGIVVQGVPLSDAASVNRYRMPAPGSRIPNDMTPAIVLKDGAPVFALSGVGSSLTPEEFRLLFGVLGHGLSPAEVLAAPPLTLNFEAFAPDETVASQKHYVPAGKYPPEFLAVVRADGMKVDEKNLNDLARGWAVYIQRDSEGSWRTTETPSEMGVARAPK